MGETGETEREMFTGEVNDNIWGTGDRTAFIAGHVEMRCQGIENLT
jgi:hypothetical protein